MKYSKVFKLLTIISFTTLTGCGLFDSGSSKTNYTNNNLNNNLNNNPNQVEAPTFSPSEGTYSTTQSVTITSATDGAVLHYTTDSTTPSCSSGTTYTAAISVSSTETIKAIACKDGMDDSDVVSAVYTINSGNPTKVATPTFNYSTGTYTPPIYVTITDSTPSTSIYYTTSGTAPTSCSGNLYTSALTINTTTTLKAIACKSGMTNSDVQSATYTINVNQQPNPPYYSPTPGTYSSSQIVTIASSNAISIRYVTNGSSLSCNSGTIYYNPITITSSTTFNAIACSYNGTGSTITTGAYTINYPSNCGYENQICCPVGICFNTSVDACNSSNHCVPCGTEASICCGTNNAGSSYGCVNGDCGLVGCYCNTSNKCSQLLGQGDNCTDSYQCESPCTCFKGTGNSQKTCCGSIH
ncbi:MAG: chitobiase/beta-hexosaminidase C-terminal domain-containing protein [Proteobacteria bacterium]|nr:chitobiase/beta-hexosaminidase C-terminal domain-containing protein [Pseudomonadota bacterium]